MSIQSKFLKFHKRILVKRFSKNIFLREKRDAVINQLRDEINNHDFLSSLQFRFFNQGSYEMGTGIKPIQGDYDIDIGLVLDFDFFFTSEFPSPKEIKGLIYDLIKPHVKNVIWKESCLTIQYQSAQESIYHVDLAIYGRELTGKLFLAKGREDSDLSEWIWELSQPRHFMEKMHRHLNRRNNDQFRRMIRYLKHWKKIHFSLEGSAALTGTGLTLLTYENFYPNFDDDLEALYNLVVSISKSFKEKWVIDGWKYRIYVRMPFHPMRDLFSRMTDQQGTEFKIKIDRLKEELHSAIHDDSIDSLYEVFGKSFPK